VGNRRSFTPEFKTKIVLESLSGTKSAAAICREYSLKPDLLSRWKAVFIERAPLAFQSEEHRSEEQARIAELERLAGRQAMELEILKRGSRLLISPQGSSAR
jgi:transposase-like protein